MPEKSHLFRWLLVFWYAQTSELIVKDFQAGHAFCFRREVHDLLGTLQGNSQSKDNLGYFREFFHYYIVHTDDSGTPVPDDEHDLIILRKPLKVPINLFFDFRFPIFYLSNNGDLALPISFSAWDFSAHSGNASTLLFFPT